MPPKAPAWPPSGSLTRRFHRQGPPSELSRGGDRARLARGGGCHQLIIRPALSVEHLLCARRGAMSKTKRPVSVKPPSLKSSCDRKSSRPWSGRGCARGAAWRSRPPSSDPADVWGVVSLQVHQEAGAHLEGPRPRRGERYAFVHPCTRSVCQSTGGATGSLGQAQAPKPRDVSTLPGVMSSGGVPLAGQPQATGSGFKPSARGTGRLPGGDSTPASWKGSRGQPDLEGQGPAGQRKLWKRAVEGVLGQHHMAPTPVATWARDPGRLGESSQSTSSRAPPAHQHRQRVFPKRERP